MKQYLTVWQVTKDGVFYDDDWRGEQSRNDDDDSSHAAQGMMDPTTRRLMEGALDAERARGLNSADELFEVLKAKVEVNSIASTAAAASLFLKFFPGRDCGGSTNIRAAARRDAVARRCAAACTRGGRRHIFTRADAAGCGGGGVGWRRFDSVAAAWV